MLVAAATRGDAAECRALLRDGANPGAGARSSLACTALHAAVLCGHAEAVDALLSGEAGREAALTPARRSGFLPVHYAGLGADAGLCLLLLRCGSPAHEADARGRTPVEIARQHGAATLPVLELWDAGAHPVQLERAEMVRALEPLLPGVLVALCGDYAHVPEAAVAGAARRRRRRRRAQPRCGASGFTAGGAIGR